MKVQKWREIVIEVERTQIVRKKTQTHLMFCRNCGREVDFVSLSEAAALFTANAENLLKFVRVSRSHFETGADGEIYLCLVSFLASMKAKTNASQIKSPAEFDVLCRNTRSKSLQVL
jgi:hypothetical protein